MPAQALAPAGRAARCGHHIVHGVTGLPPEPPEATQAEADMKRAGSAMSRPAMIQKRDEVSLLVSMELRRGRATAGRTEKGGSARPNYCKTNPDVMPEWVRMESEGWQQLAENVAGASPLSLPVGQTLPYDAVIYDGFPSWEALGKGIPVRATLNKVRPEMDFAAYKARTAAVMGRPRVDIAKLIEVVRAT